MEKEFDEKFPCLMHFLPNKKSWGYSEVGDDVKSFIYSYTRTLLESFGEEIIGKDDKDEGDWKSIYGKDEQYRRNSIRDRQRLKVKEILEEVGK